MTESWRPFCDVVIWAHGPRIRSERFYTVNTRGIVRDLKRHRNIRPSTFVRNIERAMADGHRVLFEVCNRDFYVAQRAEFQREVTS